MSIGQFWPLRQRGVDYLRHPARTGSPTEPHQPDAERIIGPAERTWSGHGRRTASKVSRGIKSPQLSRGKMMTWRARIR